MSGFQLAGRRWWLRGYLAGRPRQGGPPIHSMVGPPQGLPRCTPERILGTYTVRALLVPVRQWRRLTPALKWSTRSDNGHCQVLQLCRCSTLAVDSSGLNWMIKLSWTAMRCYRRVSFVMCFRRSVSAAWQGARGERLTVGIMLPGRQDADDWLNFMFIAEETYGLPLQPGVLSQRRSQNRSSSKSGAGCRPSICGWWSSYGGGCLLTECTSKPPLGSPKKNSMLCSLTGPPDATAQTHMKRKSIVVLESKKSKLGGRNVKIGWHTLKNKVKPFVYDFKKLLKALSDKEAVAQSEVDAVMENCAKRWQTREGTYQLKRRRLKPDVRDSPEYPCADIDMADI